MDYDVINDAIAQIISIVDNYKKEDYDEKLMENLVVALLGYYLVFGPSIFEKISKILDALHIYRCGDDKDYDSVFNAVCEVDELMKDQIDYQPITVFSLYSFDNRHFLQYSPFIIYTKMINDYREVLILSHELSHVLDGENALITKNGDAFDIDISYSKAYVDAENYNAFKNYDRSFAEFAATAVENKVLAALKSLDFTKINYVFVKEIVYRLSMNGINISNGYTSKYVLFKDLVDNPKFFELMKKYYFESYNEQEFKKDYESFGSDLSYGRLKHYICKIFNSDDEEYNYFRFLELIKREVDKFSNYTQFEPKKEILLLV